MRPATTITRWLAALAAVFVLGRALVASGVESGSIEYKIKAGYLYNFGKFVEWPESRASTNGSPFVIGIIDGDGALPVMELVLAGKLIHNRPVEVKSVSPSNLDGSVHILFVTRSSGRTLAEIQGAVAGAPVLVVGETDLFAENGGMVGFVRENETIKLTLNLEAANRVGLKISSKLSSVSRLVKDQGIKSRK